MKRTLLCSFVAILGTTASNAQTPIPIPDTLTGTNITLTMHKDSVAFFPGDKTQTFAFNQYAYLGPTIILNQGQNVSIMVNNQIGDTTNVHWHGLHVAPSNDGGPHIMIPDGMSWNPSFNVMDKAATYWYHPHFHGKTAKHAIKGATGMLIVRDNEEAALDLPRKYGVDDFPIIVQSAEFDNMNQPMPEGMQDSILLVNGVRANYGQSAFLNVPAQVIRLRLLNASGERTFNFGFTNSMGFKIIGSDGGLLSAPVNATRIRIAPGERYEILLDVSGMTGQSLYLMSYASELPTGVQGGPTMNMPSGPPMDSPLNGIDFDILKLMIGAPTSAPVTTIPNTLVAVMPIPAAQSDITRKIKMTAEDQMSMDGPFFFNNQLFDMDRIDYRVTLNNTEIWELTNSTMVAHPFHIHDVQFYVLDRDGNMPPAHERGRKDVVAVNPFETVRFIAKFETFTDTLMPYPFHCHILMHEDDGMMGQFLVVPKPLGINESLKLAAPVKVYPNPATDYFSFDILDVKAFDIKMFDISGKMVRSEYGATSKNISIKGMASGTYQIVIRANETFYTAKIAVRK